MEILLKSYNPSPDAKHTVSPSKHYDRRSLRGLCAFSRLPMSMCSQPVLAEALTSPLLMQWVSL
eukprot:1014133-Amphidinium_carterae.1